MGKIMVDNLRDLCGWLLIAAMAYAGFVFTCALDDSCAAIFMVPLL